MSVQYYGYSRMPTNLNEAFPYLELEKAKQEFKQYTVYTPKTKQINRFVYTGTEINQNLNQIPVLQRSLIEGLPIPICEYYNRVVHIEPRPDYVIGVDMTDTSIKKLWKK